MKLDGSTTVAQRAADVFDRLLDPDFLARCIPGCERMERREDGSYEAVVKAGVGAIKGSFRGVVTLSEVVSPESYRMSLSGKSTVGFVEGSALIRLEADAEGEGERTWIHYDGEARVSGVIASVGGRLVDAAARKVCRQFFERLAQEVGQ